MFTGIVRGCGSITRVERRPGLVTLGIDCPPEVADGLELGGSVAVDGVCLTCVRTEGSVLAFDVMSETLARTTLGTLAIDDIVNLQRSARDGAEIGGHPISGHVDDTAEIVGVDRPENNWVVTFAVNPERMKYIFPKGYIALNGTSLTIASVDRAAHSFQVWFIPETLQRTTFGKKRVGDKVNLEIERGTQVTVDTIRNFLEERFAALPGVADLLERALLPDAVTRRPGN